MEKIKFDTEVKHKYKVLQQVSKSTSLLSTAEHEALMRLILVSCAAASTLSTLHPLHAQLHPRRHSPVSSCRWAVFRVEVSSSRLSLLPFIFQFPPTKNFRSAMAGRRWLVPGEEDAGGRRTRCCGRTGERVRCGGKYEQRSSSHPGLQIIQQLSGALAPPAVHTLPCA